MSTETQQGTWSDVPHGSACFDVQIGKLRLEEPFKLGAGAQTWVAGF